MSVQGPIGPRLLCVVSQFKPFFTFIPPVPFQVRGITPYALAVVQYSELFAYSSDRAIGAVVLRSFPHEKRVFLKALSGHFLGEKEIGGNTFARCAYLPTELVRHMFRLGHSWLKGNLAERVVTTFFRVPIFAWVCRK